MKQRYKKLRIIVTSVHDKFESGTINLSLYSRWINRLNKIDKYFLRSHRDLVDSYWEDVWSNKT